MQLVQKNLIGICGSDSTAARLAWLSLSSSLLFESCNTSHQHQGALIVQFAFKHQKDRYQLCLFWQMVYNSYGSKGNGPCPLYLTTHVWVSNKELALNVS